MPNTKKSVHTLRGDNRWQHSLWQKLTVKLLLIRPAFVNNFATALSLIMLMRLHPMMPKAKELLAFGTMDGLSFGALVFNSVMLGRLRT